MNRNISKTIPNIINCDLKKDWQILIIFGANIFWHYLASNDFLVPTSPNVCFCTTWKNTNRQNRIKMLSWFCFPQVVQKQTMGAVKNWTDIRSPVVYNNIKNQLASSGKSSGLYAHAVNVRNICEIIHQPEHWKMT